MKTKSLSVALLAGAATIAQANPGAYHGGGGGFRGGAVARGAPAGDAPARAGGFSSMHSMPTRSFGGRVRYPGHRYSSFGMRSYRPTGYRQPSVYPHPETLTRSGRIVFAAIRQPNRFLRSDLMD